ncbi:MAG: XRE family transcriptional regulator [Pseudomonadota bacterium]
MTTATTNHHVGADIRAFRSVRDVTLADLANAVQRSVGWLSQIERGQREPAISDLRKIAAHFDVPLSFFFRNDEADAGEHGIVVRKDLRAALGSQHDGLIEELLSPNLSGEFEMLRSTFAAGAQSEWVQARPTQEGGYVVSGELTLEIGAKHFALKAGDSFQFENETYRWSNPTDEDAVAIWVISPPVY